MKNKGKLKYIGCKTYRVTTGQNVQHWPKHKKGSRTFVTLDKKPQFILADLASLYE